VQSGFGYGLETMFWRYKHLAHATLTDSVDDAVWAEHSTNHRGPTSVAQKDT